MHYHNTAKGTVGMSNSCCCCCCRCRQHKMLLHCHYSQHNPLCYFCLLQAGTCCSSRITYFFRNLSLSFVFNDDFVVLSVILLYYRPSVVMSCFAVGFYDRLNGLVNTKIVKLIENIQQCCQIEAEGQKQTIRLDISIS